MTTIVSVQASQFHTSDVYHTRECRVAPDSTTEITKAEAERRGLEKCSVCTDDYEPHKESDPMKWHKKAQEIAND
jgi:hypothetical protein